MLPAYKRIPLFFLGGGSQAGGGVYSAHTEFTHSFQDKRKKRQIVERDPCLSSLEVMTVAMGRAVCLGSFQLAGSLTAS